MDGYHLLSGSVAIGKGLVTGVARDIDGDARVGIPDLGADEVVGPVEWHYLYLPLIPRN